MKSKRNLKTILSGLLMAAIMCTSVSPLQVRADESILIDNGLEITYEKDIELDLQEQIPEEVTNFVQSSSISAYNLTKKIDIDESEDGIRPVSRSRSIADGSVTDYITTVGGDALYYIDLPGGYYLQAQLDLPKNASLDYDLYLLDSQGYDLSGSEYFTHINGASGTLSETVAYKTITAETTRYYFYVYAAVGASISEPFVLKYSISVAGEYDAYETDSNATKALPVTFGVDGALVNVRNINSSIDNDWYSFTVPSSRSYDTLQVTVSTNSSNTCGVEVYTNVGSSDSYKMAKQSLSNGQLTLGTGTYYIRVYNTATSFNSNDIQSYSLTLLPILRATNIAITDLNGTEGLNKVVNYPGYGARFRTGTGNLTIMGVVYANVNGELYAVNNASITGRYHNQSWEDNNTPGNANRYQTTVSGMDGSFSIVIALPSGAGRCTHDTGTSYHYFDDCFAEAYVTNQSSIQNKVNIWHLAYSMYHG